MVVMVALCMVALLTAAVLPSTSAVVIQQAGSNTHANPKEDLVDAMMMISMPLLIPWNAALVDSNASVEACRFLPNHDVTTAAGSTVSGVTTRAGFYSYRNILNIFCSTYRKSSDLKI